MYMVTKFFSDLMHAIRVYLDVQDVAIVTYLFIIG